MAALLWSKNDVVKPRLALDRHFQTHRERFARGRASLRFFFCEIAIWIAPWIDSFEGLRASAFRNLLLYLVVVTLFLRGEIAIGLAFFEKTVRGGAMLRRVIRLEDEIFVVVETEPLESVDDRAGRLVGRALQICVFDAQEKLAAGFAGEEPVEESGTGGADVQVTRGRWCEAYADSHDNKKVVSSRFSEKHSTDQLATNYSATTDQSLAEMTGFEPVKGF